MLHYIRALVCAIALLPQIAQSSATPSTSESSTESKDSSIDSSVESDTKPSTKSHATTSNMPTTTNATTNAIDTQTNTSQINMTHLQPTLAEQDSTQSIKEAPPKQHKQKDKSYDNLMKLLEHEGTYMILWQSLGPYYIYGNNMNTELKFQVSAKIPVWTNALWTKGSIFFGYTQTMWFQQFNFRYSSPIRDTDYKPSVFYSYPFEGRFGIKELRIGFLHYSNGIGGDECVRDANNNSSPNCRSRSGANRIMFEAIFEVKGFDAHLSAWPYLSDRRDNPDLDQYLGYANVKLYYRHKRNLVEVHFAPLISDYTRYHASVRLGYAFAMTKFISLYAQYFYGYGDSLYEYNMMSNRIGLGVRVTGF